MQEARKSADAPHTQHNLPAQPISDEVPCRIARAARSTT